MRTILMHGQQGPRTHSNEKMRLSAALKVDGNKIPQPKKNNVISTTGGK